MRKKTRHRPASAAHISRRRTTGSSPAKGKPGTAAAKQSGRKRTAAATVVKIVRKKTPVADRSPARRRIARKPLAPVVLAACTLLLGADLLLTAPSPAPNTFKGYVTVCYRGSRPLAEAAAELAKLPGVDAVVSRETAEVLYTDFSGLAAVPLARAASRFDSLDPRYDEYMRRLERYFTVRVGDETWHVCYAATGLSPFSLSLAVGKIGGTLSADWIVDAGTLTTVTIAVVLLGSAFFFFLLLQARRPLFRLLISFGVLPWLHVIPGAGFTEFVLVLFLSAYWTLFLNECLLLYECTSWNGSRDLVPSPCFLRLGMSALMIIFTAILTAVRTSRPDAVALALLCQAVLAAGYCFSLRALWALRKRKFDVWFRKFRPLAVLRRYTPPGPMSRGRAPVSGLAVVFLCLIPPVLAAMPSSPAGRLPVPRPKETGASIDMNSIRRLAREKLPSSLPDLSDFVRHAASQERLAYTGEPSDAMPAPGEGIIVSAYRPDASGRAIERTARTVLSFDDDWLAGLAAVSGRSSVERMLFAQGRCAAVVPGGTPADGDGWTLVAIFSIVLFPIIMLQYMALPRFVYGKKKSARRTAGKKR